MFGTLAEHSVCFFHQHNKLALRLAYSTTFIFSLQCYAFIFRCTYNKCGSILTEQETSNIPDQTMPEFSFNGYTDAIETNGLAEGYDARFYMDYVFKQFGIADLSDILR